jgi:alpha-L-fucosidase
LSLSSFKKYSRCRSRQKQQPASLSIAPHADGSIRARIQKTLFAMGDWLKVSAFRWHL